MQKQPDSLPPWTDEQIITFVISHTRETFCCRLSAASETEALFRGQDVFGFTVTPERLYVSSVMTVTVLLKVCWCRGKHNNIFQLVNQIINSLVPVNMQEFNYVFERNNPAQSCHDQIITFVIQVQSSCCFISSLCDSVALEERMFWLPLRGWTLAL